MSKSTMDSPLTFRAATKNRQQLKELKNLWNDESLSRVIVRCIEWAWLIEIGSSKIDVKPSDVRDSEKIEKGNKYE